MLSFKQHLTEAKLHPDIVKKLEHSAYRAYDEAHPDLPSHGKFHFLSAHGYMCDRMYDDIHKEHPEATKGNHIERIAKSVLKQYADDDTRKSRANERKAMKPKKEPRPPKVKKTWWQEMGLSKKPTKGIGSY